MADILTDRTTEGPDPGVRLSVSHVLRPKTVDAHWLYPGMGNYCIVHGNRENKQRDGRCIEVELYVAWW